MSSTTQDPPVENENVNAEEQMETFGEGKVAHAVEKASNQRHKGTAQPMEIVDPASDLDR